LNIGSTSNFIAAYITLPIFAFCYFGWKLYAKTKIVKLEDIDFHTGMKELDEMAEREAAKYVAPKTFSQKLWEWLM
jgi:yeast amino acid transporter